MFWNINGKDLSSEAVQLVDENEIDVLLLAESENFDCEYLLYELGRRGRFFTYCEGSDRQGSDIKVFHKAEVRVELMKSEDHYSVYQVPYGDDICIMFVVHLLSGCFKNECARATRLTRMSQLFEKIEEEVFRDGEFQSFIVGDFNLHPFSTGIIGSMSFNAIFSLHKAKMDRMRMIGCERRKFYYNPMWRLMGKDEKVLGTYYSTYDEGDDSFYWYTWDQVLIRPALIDDFNFDEFAIVDCVGEEHFVTQNQVISRAFSDHLPIKFEIR